MNASNLNKLTAIRKAAKSSGLAKKVFSQGGDGLAIAQLTMAMRSAFKVAGVDMPKGANITLDAAQMILAGGVFVGNAQRGVSLAQNANPLAVTIASTAQLLADCGVIDSQIADFTSLAVNGLMVISSGGANILADIGAVLALIQVVGDLKNDIGGSQKAATMIAKKELKNAVNEYLGNQYSYAVAQVGAFNRGKLNPFDMIGNIALNAPDEFKDFFPDLACYFPSWMNVEIVVTGESKGWFGSKYDVERAHFIHLVTTKQEVQSVLVNKFIAQPMKAFFADTFQSRRISLKALSVMAMILSTSYKGAPSIGFDFDIVGCMRALGITPSMLGDDWLFQGGLSHDTNLFVGKDFDPDLQLPYVPLTLPPASGDIKPGLYINNKASENSTMAENRDYREHLKRFQYNLFLADKYGDIETLCTNPESMAMLKEWAKIMVTPAWTTENDEPVGMILKPGHAPISAQSWHFKGKAPAPGQVEQYIREHYTIDFSDYWKCLNVLKSMKQANLFQDIENVLDQYGDPLGIEETFTKTFPVVLAKNVNQIARSNIADYLGVEYSQLKTRKSAAGTLYYFKKAS